MRIGIYGYGKMGKVIETCAIDRGHSVTLKVGSDNAGTKPFDMDVAIEFSRPDTAVDNIKLLVESGIPVVVGTTGWYDDLYLVKDLVRQHNGAVLYASNFSVGVNLFFRMNQHLTALMAGQEQYGVHMEELHHIHKVDAPSGTALTLVRDIILQHKRYSGYTLDEPSNDQIGITAVREGEIPGTHRVKWSSEEDEITIEHKAFGREGFAIGSVVAAEWLVNSEADGELKSGLFTFDDVLNNY